MDLLEVLKRLNDSGNGSSEGTDEATKATKALESVTEEVKKAVIAVYNKNSNEGETKDVAIWAANKVSKLCEHAANLTAARIIKEIEERKKSRAAAASKGMLEALVAIMALSEDGKSSSNGKSLSDSSTKEIKYPWTKQEELGRGAFGIVYRAKGPDGFMFAAKEVQRQGQEAKSLREEISCLTKLSHPNIVKCYGYAEGGGKIFMYLELLTGSVHDMMKKKEKACTALEARKFTIDIVKGLTYLHSKDMIHRDIKCGNVLLDDTGKAKLADMGLTKPHADQTVATYSDTAGTILWMSPEALTQNLVGKRADIWSLGCTVYEMLTRLPPFADLGAMAILMLHSRGDFSRYKNLMDKDKSIPVNIKQFLLEIFVPFGKRPYVEKIAKHKWLS